MSFKLTGVGNAYSFVLPPGATLVVGRATGVDCSVVDSTVSRHHAEVAAAEFGVQVTDTHSSNGTYVNGVKVDSYFVVAGETVTFGSLVFRLEETGDAAVPAPIEPPEAAARRAAAAVIRPVPRPTDAIATIKETSGSIKKVIAEALTPVERDRQKLRILLEVSRGLTRAIDVDALLKKVADYAFEILEADRCAILLRDEASGTLTTKFSRDRSGADAPQPVPQVLVQRAVEEKVAVLSNDAGDGPPDGVERRARPRLQSALGAPLIGSGDVVLGVLYVDNFAGTGRFGEADLDFVISFAGIAAVAIENSEFSDRIRREALVRSNFERYFAPKLAASISASAGALKLGGEKRSVAVLFSDIRGFTALAESMKPDAMAKLLTEYFTEMVDCVFRHGGTLDKFIGDSVMAQWGAPLGDTDDADNAMEAALDMMQALARLNARWAREGRPTLQMGIGLNFGEVFAGNIGSERRLEYTVIGDAVNLANGLCHAARGGEILVSENFRLHLKDPPRLVPMPARELKGRSQAIPVFGVTP
jgi:adenylate cyclase